MLIKDAVFAGMSEDWANVGSPKDKQNTNDVIAAIENFRMNDFFFLLVSDVTISL